MIRILIVITLLLFCCSFSQAATGDILYQNCTGTSACDPGKEVDTIRSSPAWIREVKTSGCYSGSCLKLTGYANTLNPGIYGAGNTSMTNSTINGKKEITISQWVKYNKDVNSISGGNMKLDRAYTGGSLDFYATSIVPSFSHDYYMGAVTGTMINKAPWFNMVLQQWSNLYPINNGDGTYTVQGYIKGSITVDGPTAPGTTWVRVTKWLKLPTTSGGTNGAVKVWIGDQLLFEIINAGYTDQYAGGTTFSTLAFYPSSEAEQAFEHWTDEMIIYEGYVPPGPQTPVNGQCNNTYNGQILTGISISDPICSVGAIGSAALDPPTATWQCLGQYGGNTVNCSATVTTNEEPQTEECSTVNYNICDPIQCSELGLFYWEGVCNTVARPANFITSNLISNSNVSDWPAGQQLPTNFTSYVPNNVSKTFRGARMFNNALLNPTIFLDPDTTYTAVYNLLTTQGHGKIWVFGFPEDYLNSAPGTIIHQFTTPSVMNDRKIYFGSEVDSNIEANNFRLYKSTNYIPSKQAKLNGIRIKSVSDN